MQRILFSVALLLLALNCFPPQAMADENEVWWSSAEREAERDGYQLISTEQLSGILNSAKSPLVLDARADYEYEGGHIPGSVNLEFDLGDRTSLSPEKRSAFQALLGKDKHKRIILYCRSFR